VVGADGKDGAGGVVEAPVVDGRVRRPSPRSPTLGATRESPEADKEEAASDGGGGRSRRAVTCEQRSVTVVVRSSMRAREPSRVESRRRRLSKSRSGLGGIVNTSVPSRVPTRSLT